MDAGRGAESPVHPAYCGGGDQFAWQFTDRSESDEFGRSLDRDDDRVIIEQVSIAARRGVSRAQVALALVARHPTVAAPIVGATKPHHLDDAIASLAVELTAEEIKQLEERYTARPIAGFG